MQQFLFTSLFIAGSLRADLIPPLYHLQTVVANDRMQGNVGQILRSTPGNDVLNGPVPDPLAMSLMGGGLSLAALLHRKFAKK